jgi:hypothetical protein
MEFRILVEVHLAGRVLHKQLVAQVEREATGIGPEEIGLTLEEGKTFVVSGQCRAARSPARRANQGIPERNAGGGGSKLVQLG